MGMKIAIFVSALLAAPPAPASAAREPAGWQVEAESGSCTAKRPLGSDGTVLGLLRTSGNDLTTLSITGEGAKRFSRQELADVALHLDPGGAVPAKAELTPEFIVYPVSLYIRSEDRGFLDRMAAARAMRLFQGKQVMLQHDLAGLGAAVVQLRSCERIGLEAAGIDVARWESLRAGPRPLVELIRLVRVKDYPREARRAGASGRVTVRLTVSASGQPAKCDYVARSGHEALDRVTCKILLERARFHPAIDSHGKAVAAPFVMKITWRTG